jgi:GT2 family glycosyltransferase
MNPKVSIIILNWNGKDYSKRCLKSIKQNVRYPNYEVIFVDNASTDGSVEMVEKEFPKTKVIKNPKNYGCAKGYNEGVKIAEGDIIFLLNNDTKVLPKTIEKMVSFLVSNPKIGIVGPKLLYPDGRLQPSCRTFPSLRGELFSALFLDMIFLKSPFFNKYHIGNFDYDKIKEVDQPLGSALMIKKEIIDKIGLLDERYFIYYEEVDFCYRAKKAGYKIFFIPYAEMIHYGGKSSEKIPVKTS